MAQAKRAQIEVFKNRRHRWLARKRYARGGLVVALHGRSYSTRMNARRAAHREHPELQIVSI